MKTKFFVMAAMAALFSMGFTACSNNDEDLTAKQDMAEKYGIGFAPSIEGPAQVTRGYATTAANVLTTVEHFNVWGVDAVTDGLYMGASTSEGRGVSYSAGSWSYLPVQFWPVNKLNFVAIAPATKTAGVYGNPAGVTSTSVATSGYVESPLAYSTSTLTTNVTLPLNVEDQADIMFANSTSVDDNGTPADDSDDTEVAGPTDKDQHNGDVPLMFKHALSQVVFKGQLPTSGAVTKVEIAEITIGRVGKTGTLTYTSTGVFNGGSATIVPSASDNFQLDASDLEAATWGVNLTNDGIANATAGTAFDLTISESASKKNAWFMLPQALTAWVPTDDSELKAGALNAAPASGSYLKIRATLSKDGVVILNNTDPIYIPLGTTWERGKKYTYTIEFNGTAALTPITFSVTAQDWTDATGIDLEM
jgi:hypothetical protein